MDRKLKHNTLLLCFSLIICLSVWQLITGPGPPFDVEDPPSPSQFAPYMITDHNATFEYPIHQMPNADYTRLIDLDKFEFTILNQSCNETSPLLLILIHSAPQNFHRRKVIRETWGQKMDNVVLLFALGKVNTQWQQQLDAENDTYGDFIQGNFVDTYKNVTYKHAMVFKYAIYHCPSAKYILKADDDVFVNLVTYMELLHEELTPHGARDLLFCNVRWSPIVNRSYRSKWRVSYREYPEAYFPDMCPGWTVLYSTDSLFKLYTELQKAEYFWIDDALITGILREKANLTLQHNFDWVMPSTFFLDSLHLGIPTKPFLYGPGEMDTVDIRRLWNYTMKHYKSKNFHYAFDHNRTLLLV